MPSWLTDDVNVVDSKGLECVVDNLVAAFRSRNVGPDEMDLAFADSFLNHGDNLKGTRLRGFGHVVDRDKGASSGKSESNTSANAVFTARSSDDGDLACEGLG